MRSLLPIAVFLLMVSVGLGIRLNEVFANWRRHTWGTWLLLVTATFVIPSALALGLANFFHLTLGETAGLFLVGAAPGAPLLTRNMARRGFDLHVAASYQLWAGLMVPVMIPPVVAVAGKLYGHQIWIPPIVLLGQIVEKQFLPLGVGILIAWYAPKIGEWCGPTLNTVGNVLLGVMMAAVLFKMGPELKLITPWVPVAVVLLAVGSIGAMMVVRMSSGVVRQTFAVCNANRHVGLALLLSGQYIHAKNALPVVACYALAAPLVMFLYVKIYPAATAVQE